MSKINKPGISEKSVTIPHGEKEISGLLTSPSTQTPPSHLMVLTHGAGGDMFHHQLAALAATMATAGFGVLRFTCKGLNIVYRTRVYTSVIEYALKQYPDVKGLFLAGRSMGSRAAVGASLSASPAVSSKIRGIVGLAYPLHPPNDTKALRDQPLMETQHPCLFVSGTNDEMAHRDLLENTVSKMSNKQTTIAWIDGANHAHKVKGRTEDSVTEDICRLVVNWCQRMTDGESPEKIEATSKKGVTGTVEKGQKGRKRKRVN